MMMEEKKIEIIVMLIKQTRKKKLQTSTRHRNCGMMKDHPTRTLWNRSTITPCDVPFLIAKNALYLYDINNFIIINMMGSEQKQLKKNVYRIIYFKHKIVGVSITSLILINWCTVCYDNVILNHWFYLSWVGTVFGLWIYKSNDMVYVVLNISHRTIFI